MARPDSGLGRLDALVRRAIPPQLAADDDRQRRAFLLVSFCLVLLVTMPVFLGVAAFVFRLPVVAAIAVVAMVAGAATPVVLRRTGSLPIATSFIIGSSVAAVLLSAAMVEGLTSPALGWLCVVPVLASTIGGRTTGQFWMAVCLALLVALTVLDRGFGLLPNHEMEAGLRRLASTWNLALLIVTMQVFASIAEVLRLRAMRALAAARDELSASREQALVNDRLVAVGRMAAGVAHEINNPLTMVLSNVEHVLSEVEAGSSGRPGDLPEAVKALRDASAGARRVRDIVRDLKMLVSAGDEGVNAVKLSEVVEASLGLLAAELRGTVTVERAFTQVPPVSANEAHLGQVLMNLLTNAAAAMPPRDPGQNVVRVSTGVAEGEVFVEVADNGVGMTPEVLARIFDPFFTTRSVGQGAGLGLSICRSLVQAVGGRLTVETTPGVGSRFRVYLRPADGAPVGGLGPDGPPNVARCPPR